MTCVEAGRTGGLWAVGVSVVIQAESESHEEGEPRASLDPGLGGLSEKSLEVARGQGLPTPADLGVLTGAERRRH